MTNAEQLMLLKRSINDWNKWRNDNPRIKIDLKGADLSHIDLSRADLSNADLSEIDLVGAKLSRADFSSSDLSRAKLSTANLTNADFTNTILDQADLSGADLLGARLIDSYLPNALLIKTDLTHAALWGTRMNGADLTGAYSKFGDFRNADLTNACLKEARFQSVSFRNADLAGANLTGAYLGDVDLTNAKLNDAIFSKATFGWVNFVQNNLSTTLGLETTVHESPSIIDIVTIRLSKGKLPINFLRGCGLSDLEIEFSKLSSPGLNSEQVTEVAYELNRLYTDQPILFYSCFISHSSKDLDFANRLYVDLQNNGVRCYLTSEDLKIGDEFRKSIGQQIRFRDKLLVILSVNSIQSEWVGDEVEKALEEEKEQGKLKLFPIRIDNAIFNAKDDWAEKIRLRRHIGDFSSSYDKGFKKLLQDLKAY